MADRVAALEEIIGEYQDERAVEASRLEEYRLQRAKLELAREILLEHNELEEAEQLKVRIHDLDHRIQASERTIARIDRLLAVFRRSLEQLRQGTRVS
jgi:hypothetical protein